MWSEVKIGRQRGDGREAHTLMLVFGLYVMPKYKRVTEVTAAM
jgi:hypothetical protein